MAVEQLAKLLYRVGIDTVGGYIVLADGFGDGVAFTFRARCEDYFVEYVGILGAFVSHYGTYAAGSYDEYF